MDKAQELVRMVVRAFYEPEATIIVDALVRHIALSYSDVQWIFQNSMKHKNALLGPIQALKNGGLIREFQRDETKANAQKATKVTYYYIDYRHAVDATKYRLHTLGSQLRKSAGPTEEKKEYRCPRCKSEFKEIDVIGSSSMDFSTFLCLTCGHDLEYIEQDAEDAEATGPVGVFNKSLGWLINHMQIIDGVTIPATSWEAAFAQREEPPRPKPALANPVVDVPGMNPAPRPQAVKGIVTGPQQIAVTISTDEDNTADRAAASLEQKAKLAQQNALPDWYTKSTISGEVTTIGQKEEAARREREAEMGMLSSGGAEEKKDVKSDGLEDIFAAIEREQAEEAAKREVENEEEYESEEEEFEDVPASSAGDVNGSGPPEAKKVKLEVDTPVSQATPASGADEDEDEEFEDV